MLFVRFIVFAILLVAITALARKVINNQKIADTIQKDWELILGFIVYAILTFFFSIDSFIAMIFSFAAIVLMILVRYILSIKEKQKGM